jgi:hypothetical protein
MGSSFCRNFQKVMLLAKVCMSRFLFAIFFMTVTEGQGLQGFVRWLEPWRRMGALAKAPSWSWLSCWTWWERILQRMPARSSRPCLPDQHCSQQVVYSIVVFLTYSMTGRNIWLKYLIVFGMCSFDTYRYRAVCRFSRTFGRFQLVWFKMYSFETSTIWDISSYP